MREKSVKTLLITTKENHVELMKVIAGHVCACSSDEDMDEK